jgi:hypothetical protein
MTAPSADRRVWFRAKRYGIGWGLPCAWQGWVVLGVWFLLMLAGTPLLPEHPLWFALHTVVLAALLIFVCWLKGEKVRWRWGGD